MEKQKMDLATILVFVFEGLHAAYGVYCEITAIINSANNGIEWNSLSVLLVLLEILSFVLYFIVPLVLMTIAYEKKNKVLALVSMIIKIVLNFISFVSTVIYQYYLSQQSSYSYGFKEYLPSIISIVVFSGLLIFANKTIPWEKKSVQNSMNYQAPVQPQYQSPVQPQYQTPVQPQYQAPVQPQYQAPAQQPTQQFTNADFVEEIKGLKELLDMGAITQEEYDMKKSQLLSGNIGSIYGNNNSNNSAYY